MSRRGDDPPRVLVLGIGNVLVADEGIGVHVVRRLEQAKLPPGVRCLDGGTGSFALLGAMDEADRLVLVDATLDDSPPGTLTVLRPRFSTDYPRTLTAHDIGLKDLLDTFHLTDGARDVTLFAVSIAPQQPMGTELSPAMERRVPEIAAALLRHLGAAAASRDTMTAAGNGQLRRSG